MNRTRITINGREYDGPETMPPDVRRAWDEAMRQAAPALQAGPGSRDGLVIENRIVVNGRTFQRLDDMPPDVRSLYEDAMRQARGGSGITVRRSGPTFSIEFTRGGRAAPTSGVSPETGRPIEPSSIESSLRTAVVLLALLVIGGLTAWALLGR